MKLHCETYEAQNARWPKQGRHILAQFDDDSVVVYQAYRPAIGHFAATNGYFGGEFSLNRMSWIKPNFLWMMYRCGWATKPGQEVVLAVTIKRTAFEHILEQAVHSSYVADVYGSQEQWKRRLAESNVRLQWDPDHAPTGSKLERRAIQLGLRGDVLRNYAREWIVDIEDVSPFVREQAAHRTNHATLVTPREHVFEPTTASVRSHLGLSSSPD